MSAPRTGLLDWLDDPAEGRGFHFADEEGGWELWDYPRVAGLVGAAAEQITQLRHRDRGPVSIVARTGPEFVAAFLGSLVAGHTPSPLALPLFARDRQRYVDHAAAILAATDPALILADPGVGEILTEAAAAAGLDHGPHALSLEPGDAREPRRAAPADLALLQFTSGSSGTPRGVRVSWENLETNVAQIRGWLEMRPEDHTASWLPLYHDMGLIGCFLTPLVNQSDSWIMRPDQFIANPLRWLECFGRRGAQLSVAPNFGFAYTAKRVADEALEGMDLSAWRTAIVGAERLDAAVLSSFAARLAPYGFRPETFLPAYGLAEATLAVTGVPLREVPRAVRPDWSSAAFGEPMAIEEEATFADPERVGDGNGWVVGCGRPFAEIGVEILDEDGDPLGDGRLGEIAVTGPTVARGYAREAAGGSTRFAGDTLRTGDAGFTVDGELFVMGRLGDSVKIRGRTVFVEDVEARLASVGGVQKGKCVVLAGSDGARDHLVALVEAPAGAWVDDVAVALRAAVGVEARVRVLAGGPGAIERTSSGKPRRRVMWQRLLEDALEGEVVYDSGALEPAPR